MQENVPIFKHFPGEHAPDPPSRACLWYPETLTQNPSPPPSPKRRSATDSYCDWQSDCTTDSYISNKDDRTTDGYICSKDDRATGGYICNKDYSATDGYICNKDDMTIDDNADSRSCYT